MKRLLSALTLVCLAAAASAETITLASTTSTQNSGLYDEILPLFQAETGIKVNVVAVGTGQALRIARNGDADVLLVHHRASEETFVAEGFGIDRRDVMYNDFVLIGPADDPAGVAETPLISDALRRIETSGAVFASRGDDSGTHKKEQELWQTAGIAPSGKWYRETGSGMGTTLNTGVAMDAYVLTDRGTWITFGNKGTHRLLLSGDPSLFNPYGIILVNPARHPHVKAAAGQVFMDWIVSDAGQQAIAAFEIEGQLAFCPNALSYQQARAQSRTICPAD